MAELTDEMRAFIVTAHAEFKRPIEIIAMLREEFGVEVGSDQVLKYNPTKAAFEGKAEYRDLFEMARKHYVENVTAEPIANQGFRLRELRGLYEAAKKAKNHVLAASLLEQVAKEVGGALTNERVFKGDGRPMQPDVMSAEERRQSMLDLVTDALAKRGAATQDGTPTVQ